jgi:hypothetical protein
LKRCKGVGKSCRRKLEVEANLAAKGGAKIRKLNYDAEGKNMRGRKGLLIESETTQF